MTQQPPVIIFGGSSGGNFYENYQNYLEDLVDNGYSVLSLAYFDYNSSGELPNKLRHIPLEYFKKAMDWMKEQPQTSKGQFAVIGNSRGGEAALLLGIQYPEISTVVAIVSSAYVGGAYDKKRKVTGSAWTFEGKEIAYVDYQKAISNYKPWWKIIDDEEEVEPFAIPVEKLSAAVLLRSGEKDAIWPSTEMSERIIRRFEKNHYNFPFQHISYDAGHNVRVESWPDLLRFIKKHYPR
jgi:pimeloyl-ACP methyl ester carboxylesterase